MTKTMTFMCAWCNEKIREFGGKPGMAHGICTDCRAKFFPETLRTVQENAQAIVWDCLRAIGGASAVLLLLFVLGVPCFAADTAILPDKPQPQTAVHVADKEFWIEASALGAAWTLDTVSTAKSFSDNSSMHEVGQLYHGSRSTAKVMGAWAAVDLGAAVAAYEWKKHVRNRYLHPLWRVPMLVGTIGHDQAAIGNWSVGKGSMPAVSVNAPQNSIVESGLPVPPMPPSPSRITRTVHY
jgi:hypothetical protein